MANVTKKTQRSTKQQISYLCQYMHSNAAFAAGEYRTPQGAVQIDRQWAEVKAALDELGPHRSVEQWKICWRDQKRKARVEGGSQNRAINTTGNYVVVPELSQNALVVLDTIGQEMAVGIGPDESPIGFSIPASPPALPPQPSPPPTPLPRPAQIRPPRLAPIPRKAVIQRVRHGLILKQDCALQRQKRAE